MKLSGQKIKAEKAKSIVSGVVTRVRSIPSFLVGRTTPKKKKKTILGRWWVTTNQG